MNEGQSESYPNSALRGIRKSDWVQSDGQISAAAFIPDSRTTNQRPDRGKEISITWEDDDGALALLKRSGSAAANGIARIYRLRLDEIRNEPPQNRIAYERAPLEGNSYHGNIVVSGEISKPSETNIANVIAFYSKLVSG